MSFSAKAAEMIKDAGGWAGISMAELRTGEVYAHNASEVIDQPASTIKLGILCAALYKVQEGLASLDERLICGKDDKVPGSGVLQHLEDGTALTLRDMLTLMIIQSDNTATNIIIGFLTTDYVNAFFNRCLLAGTVLNRKLFDYEGIKKGVRNYICADDLTKLLCGLEKRVPLNEGCASIALDILLKQQITNKIPAYITGAYDTDGEWQKYPIKVANKTGEDSNVSHDCGIIYTPNATIILSILTKNMSGKANGFIGRFAEMAVSHFDAGALVGASS